MPRVLSMQWFVCPVFITIIIIVIIIDVSTIVWVYDNIVPELPTNHLQTVCSLFVLGHSQVKKVAPSYHNMCVDRYIVNNHSMQKPVLKSQHDLLKMCLTFIVKIFN